MGNKNNLCVECHQRPIFNKKKCLCQRCYQKIRYNQLQKGLWNPRIHHNSEIQFIESYFNHTNWIYHPAIFRLNGTNYEPDFYDGERNVFIEVSGTRQAFHKNFEKYKLFKKTFPHIKFEIRNENGTIKPLEKRKYERKSQQEKVEIQTT